MEPDQEKQNRCRHGDASENGQRPDVQFDLPWAVA